MIFPLAWWHSLFYLFHFFPYVYSYHVSCAWTVLTTSLGGKFWLTKAYFKISIYSCPSSPGSHILYVLYSMFLRIPICFFCFWLVWVVWRIIESVSRFPMYAGAPTDVPSVYKKAPRCVALGVIVGMGHYRDTKR